MPFNSSWVSEYRKSIQDIEKLCFARCQSWLSWTTLKWHLKKWPTLFVHQLTTMQRSRKKKFMKRITRQHIASKRHHQPSVVTALCERWAWRWFCDDLKFSNKPSGLHVTINCVTNRNQSFLMWLTLTVWIICDCQLISTSRCNTARRELNLSASVIQLIVHRVFHRRQCRYLTFAQSSTS